MFMYAFKALFAVALVVVFAHQATAKKSAKEIGDELKSELEKFNKDVNRQQKGLFSSREKIEKLCAQEFKIPGHKARDEYLSKIDKDPVSQPLVDCVFIKTTDGSDELLSFKRLPKNAGYLKLKRSWIAPGGFLSIGKHPFHEIPLISDGSWRLNRVKLKPSKIFPIKGMRKFTLIESAPGKGTTKSKVWVKKRFVVVRKGKPIERLYLLVRDHGKIKVFGTNVKARSWYIYSELANAVLRKSFFPRSQDALGSLTGIGLLGIVYMRNGKSFQGITREEFQPIRNYLLKFNPWK